jgi:hypothetical protein
MHKLSVAKAAPLHAMVALGGGGEEVYLLLILDLGTRWGWVVSVTPRPRFVPGKGPPVPIVQEAGWASEPVWTQRLEEKSFAPAGDRTPVVQFLDTTDWATPVPNLSVVICKTYLLRLKDLMLWYILCDYLEVLSNSLIL